MSNSEGEYQVVVVVPSNHKTQGYVQLKSRAEGLAKDCVLLRQPRGDPLQHLTEHG